jgi:hypothetical protein
MPWSTASVADTRCYEPDMFPNRLAAATAREFSAVGSCCLAVARVRSGVHEGKLVASAGLGSHEGERSLVSTTEELLGRKSSGSGLENRDYGRRNPSR